MRMGDVGYTTEGKILGRVALLATGIPRFT
jgi:hypothetical protein